MLGKLWPYFLIPVFCLMAVPDSFSESVSVNLDFPLGRMASYRNRFSVEYFSNRAELIMMASPGGSIRASVDGEWRTQEEVIPPVTLAQEEVPEGTRGVRATVTQGGSRAILLGQRQTYEQYPFTLELFNDRSFTWRITPEHTVEKFEPEFPPFRVERIDLITDLFQAWMPNLIPTLPDRSLSVGDTWTGEHRFERPFSSMEMMGRNALVALDSSYRVRDIRTRRGRVEVTIEETCSVEYQGWIHVGAASLFFGGTGSGNGRWVIDANRGVVLDRRLNINLDRPQVIKAREQDPLSDVQAEVRISLERRLDRLEE